MTIEPFFSSIEEQLLEEDRRITTRLEEVQTEERTLLERREQVQGCLKAVRPNAKSKSKSKPKSESRSPSNKEVLEAAVELLKANGPIEEADLAKLIQSRLTDNGMDLKGFALRFDNVRKTALVESSPGILTLKANNKHST